MIRRAEFFRSTVIFTNLVKTADSEKCGTLMQQWLSVVSLVPSPFFIARGKKGLVKRVFNFGSVRQDLDAANQIAERQLRHGHI